MFNFEDLDEITREAMLNAIDEAERTNNIYYSTRFNDLGKQQWLPLLKQAALQYDEHWLSYQLEAQQLMKDFEGANKPSGGYTIKHVPHTASETFSEGQFNRFYILGLCKRARTENIDYLIVYRAKERAGTRPESQSIIGNRFLIDEVESQLKITKNSFNSPLVKPNSGLSVKRP